MNQPLIKIIEEPDFKQELNGENLSDVLNWMISVMDQNNPLRFSFVLSIFAHWLQKGSLSEKQSHKIRQVYEEVVQYYQAEMLNIQLEQGEIISEALEIASKSKVSLSKDKKKRAAKEGGLRVVSGKGK